MNTCVTPISSPAQSGNLCMKLIELYMWNVQICTSIIFYLKLWEMKNK